MKKTYTIFSILFIGLFILLSGTDTFGQTAKETYTGSVLTFGTGMNTRSTTNTFTLTLTGTTSDDQAKRNLAILQDDGQDAVLKAVRSEGLGRFSIGGNLGRTLNVVRKSEVDGKIRIFCVFERWMQFAEIRGGYRSMDYPFSVIEIFIDPKTGKGSGTYIAAAHVRWKKDKKTGVEQVDIEDFATYPSKLMGVVQRGRKVL